MIESKMIPARHAGNGSFSTKIAPLFLHNMQGLQSKESADEKIILSLTRSGYRHTTVRQGRNQEL